VVNELDACHFYHTMDLPGIGVVHGEWDLRETADQYLGGVDVSGKRVLEMGTASGFLCFHMERKGAEVVAYDLSDNQQWDAVPFARMDIPAYIESRRERIREINNAYWLAHRLLSSRARVVYGTVYEVPPEIGAVDVATFGAILVHVRDPFLALQRALRLTRETVVVTEALSLAGAAASIPNQLRPGMAFRPKPELCEPRDSWWALTPAVIKRFIGVLGFERTEVVYHWHQYQGDRRILFSVIGHRTVGTPEVPVP
jgi:hypothetical protein